VNIIAADHLSKWYGQIIGLNDVTLNVPPGITGLLGPNGAGKSTFMKLMTGQLKPSKGTITVLGEPIWMNPALYFRIGFCPEQDAFYERMTGLEWVTSLVRLNGVGDAADTLARHALDLVELTGVADKKIGAYSKGMRQRVKMAQALVHDPELIVLDEPLSGMDPILRRKTIRMIKEWGRQGKSISEFLGYDDVLSLKFEDDAVVVETGRPDAFYTRLTELASSGEVGTIHEVTSPDDNLQAVFHYLVKS
jgi:ABC-2 type transport system ATP-binding protein